MALLVIFIHMNPQLQTNFVQISEIQWDNITINSLYSIIGVFLNNMTSVAVPFFFFTAGYYFFLNTEKFDNETYKGKIKKRLKTLFVPYILWNLLAVLLLILRGFYQIYVLKTPIENIGNDCITFEIISTISNIPTFFWNYFTITDNNALNLIGLSSSLSAPINIPLWFLRDLIILSITSPLIYMAVKYLRHWFMTILLIAFVLNIETLPGVNVKGLFFFSFGCYLAINKKDLLKSFEKYKWTILVSLMLLIVLVTIDSKIISTSIRHIYQVLAIIAVFPLAKSISAKTKKINLSILKYSNASFFVYAIHTIPFFIITSPRGLANLIIDKTLLTSHYEEGGGILSYILTPLLCLGLCITIYNLLKHFAPKILDLFTGGR